MQSNNFVTIAGNENEFYTCIEESVIAANLSYIDAITDWAEKRDIEMENVATFIKKNPQLKNKIQVEAEQLKLVKKTIRLPF